MADPTKPDLDKFNILEATTIVPTTEDEKKEFEAFSISRWVRDFLKVDLVIQVCGFTVFEYHFPPKKL